MKTHQTGPPDLFEKADREIQKARRNIGRAWKEIEQAKFSLARSKSAH